MHWTMTDIAPTVCQILGVRSPSCSVGGAIDPIVADLNDAKKVAVLVPDALGLFAWNLWRQEMPYLSSLHEHRSLVVRSVMPSITPVNFATMVTGATHYRHRINTFNDTFVCETVFDVLRQVGKASAGVGLHGYTGCELMGRCADICGDAGHGTDDDIVRVALEIAQSQGPEFIIVQLGQVDDVFHEFGPSSPSVVPMLKGTDERIARMISALKPLGYGTIVVSDHGQHDVPDAPKGEHRGTHGTNSDIDCQVPCTWI
jgi:predicted AlkP superfamily pyrophosphatase or phosphodiesterase